MKTLRQCRIVAAVILFAALTAFFLDFSETVPLGFAWLAKIQFMPALTGALGGLAASAVVLAVLILLTLLFGRVYCSCICPLGIMQDIIARISRLTRPRKKRFYEYRPPHRKVRLFFLVLTLFSILAGIFGLVRLSFITGVLDPYADYGRIVTHILYPVYAWGNNLLVAIARHYGSFKFYLVSNSVRSGFALATAIVSLGVVGFMAWRRGRLFCNTVCPVGALLGLLSRKSLFRIRIDADRCGSCGLCARQCKGACLNIAEKKVENDRCVVCLDCLQACRKGAIRYGVSRPAPKKEESSETVSTDGKARADLSKRLFLEGAVGLLAAGTLLRWVERAAAQDGNAPAPDPAEEKTIGGLPISENGKVPYRIEHPVLPPGSVGLRHLASRCTSCHLCVAQCPSRVIKPSLLDCGAGTLMLPVMKFSTEVFCNYDCTRCGDVCPAGAIKPISVEQKHKTQIGHVVFIKENCVVFTEETNCGACAEHCPTQAVRMVDYKGNLTIPETHEEYCVGCGACESICPVVPFKAIHVEGHETQKAAELPPKEEKIDVQLDGFGF